MPELIENGECPTPQTFNEWFTDLSSRLDLLEAAGAAALSGYLKADGTVAATAPLPIAEGSAPNHAARREDLGLWGNVTITGSGAIVIPDGSTSVVVSARSSTERAFVSAQVGTSATISVVDFTGSASVTPTVVDWMAK